MPNPSDEFKIRVATEGDPSGGKVVEDQLDRIQAKAKATESIGTPAATESVAAEAESATQLGGIFAVALAAIVKVYEWTRDSWQETQRWAQEVQHLTDKVNETEKAWGAAAASASKMGDSIHLADKIAADLAKASKEFDDFRQTQLGLWQKFQDQFIAFVNFGDKPNQRALDEAKEASDRERQRLLENANAYIDAADKRAAAVERGLKGEREAVEQLKQQLTEAEEAVKRMEPGRHIDPAGLERWNTWRRIVRDLKTDINNVTNSQERLAAAGTKAAEAAAKQAGADAAATAHQIALHDEAIAKLNEENAILRAKIAGNDEEAQKLERQRDLRREIIALEKEGLTHEEATAKAIENQNLKLQEREARESRAAGKRAFDSRNDGRQHHYDIDNRDVTDGPFDATGTPISPFEQKWRKEHGFDPGYYDRAGRYPIDPGFDDRGRSTPAATPQQQTGPAAPAGAASKPAAAGAQAGADNAVPEALAKLQAALDATRATIVAGLAAATQSVTAMGGEVKDGLKTVETAVQSAKTGMLEGLGSLGESVTGFGAEVVAKIEEQQGEIDSIWESIP